MADKFVRNEFEQLCWPRKGKTSRMKFVDRASGMIYGVLM